MGAWGTAVFSDDTPLDIRGDYRELLEDQVPDDEATRRVIEDYGHLDADEEHVLWLALAAAQSKLGRLDDEVKARVLEVIDTEGGLGLWQESGPRELQKLKNALAKLRTQMTGPQPARKAVHRAWRHETDLRTGDVLSYMPATAPCRCCAWRAWTTNVWVQLPSSSGSTGVAGRYRLGGGYDG
jgi:hypothetical protein